MSARLVFFVEGLLVVLLAIGVWYVTELPYAAAANEAPPGLAFRGQLAYNADQNMYFSYLRQAAEGEVLFENRLTHRVHRPVFFNLEWLGIGWVGKFTGLDSAWRIWRALGALVCMLGFWALARAVLKSWRRRLVALLFAGLGGGAGFWLRLLEDHTGLSLHELSRPDLFFGIHPFAQVLLNPHFSLPLGLFLAFVASYVRSELRESRAAAWIAAGVAFLEGWMRPYDLITLALFLPLYGLWQARREGLDVRRLAWRLLPLWVAAPILVYNVLLFGFHPVFRHWASQGTMPELPLGYHLLALGGAGVLACGRLFSLRRCPLRRAERVLAAWAVAVLFLFHAHRMPGLGFLTYSPQLGTTLLAAVLFLGCGLPLPGWLSARRPLAWACLTLLLGASSTGSFELWRLHRERAGVDPELYVAESLVAAGTWFESAAAPGDVVLCTYATANELARRAPVRVVLGHWSVTPRMGRLVRRVRAYLSGQLSEDEARELLRELDVRWVVLGPNERDFAREDLIGLEPRPSYAQGGVRVFAVAP